MRPLATDASAAASTRSAMLSGERARQAQDPLGPSGWDDSERDRRRVSVPRSADQLLDRFEFQRCPMRILIVPDLHDVNDIWIAGDAADQVQLARRHPFELSRSLQEVTLELVSMPLSGCQCPHKPEHPPAFRQLKPAP